MTLTFIDVMLFVLTAAVVVAVVFIVRLASQITRTAGEAEQLVRQVNHLTPRIEKILDEAEGELSDLRKLTQASEGIVSDVGAITHQTARFAVPALSNVGSLATPLKYISAATTGAKIAMQVLKKKRKQSDDSG
jgi:predicted PurR-regulated permease PerM